MDLIKRSKNPPIDPGVDESRQGRADFAKIGEREIEDGDPLGAIGIHGCVPSPEHGADRNARDDQIGQEIKDEITNEAAPSPFPIWKGDFVWFL